MRSARLLIISSLFLLFLGFLPISRALAYSPPEPEGTIEALNPDTPAVPNTHHNYVQRMMIDVMAALSCQISGVDPTREDKKCLGINSKTGELSYVEEQGGAIRTVAGLMGDIYTPPTSTAYYFKNLANNFGISKTAYAAEENACSTSLQGTGFCGLQPVISLWTAFRNIVYLLFVLIFMVIGVAIMLRVKIDPRTVMTIENQIPKIIVSLVLVTFSYAIAGFLVDLMYGSIYMTSAVVTNAGINKEGDPEFGPNVTTAIIEANNPFQAAQIAGTGSESDANILNGLGAYVRKPSEVISQALLPIFSQTGAAGSMVVGIIGGLVANAAVDPAIDALKGIGGLPGRIIIGAIDVAVTAIIGAVSATNANSIFAIATTLIAFLVLSVALLWALFRLWFALIAAYIFFLMDVIFAPFWILASLLPGSPINAASWIRDMIANLIVFPITILMFLLARILMGTFINAQEQFVPPLVGTPIGQGGIAPIIGLGIILTTPEVLKLAKNALKAPKISLQSVGQAIGVGAAYPGSVVKRAQNTWLSANEVIFKETAGGKITQGKRGFLGAVVKGGR